MTELDDEEAIRFLVKRFHGQHGGREKQAIKSANPRVSYPEHWSFQLG